MLSIVLNFNDLFFFPLFGIPLSEPFGFYDAFKRLTKKPFPTLFPENYAYAGRKNFSRNALQSGGIRRGSPPLHPKNRPETTRAV
jgi:hypothetical protein